jgi:hypothetical protein
MPSKYSVICSPHFEDSDFTTGRTYRTLKPFAIPSKFGDTSSSRNDITGSAAESDTRFPFAKVSFRDYLLCLCWAEILSPSAEFRTSGISTATVKYRLSSHLRCANHMLNDTCIYTYGRHTSAYVHTLQCLDSWQSQVYVLSLKPAFYRFHVAGEPDVQLCWMKILLIYCIMIVIQVIIIHSDYNYNRIVGF